MLINNQAQLLTSLSERIANHAGEKRLLIAIAGPPAAGKSTLLKELVAGLAGRFGTNHVIGLPMDGFHLDNVQLDEAGLRLVKGSPATFDVGGLLSLTRRLCAGEEPVYAPEFDRSSDLSRNCAIKVSASHKVVLLEGNYLLLNQAPWQSLAPYFSVTVSIDVPMETLHQRLLERWKHHGLTESDALRRAESNDIPNAHTVVQHSVQADIVYQPRI